MSIMKPSASAGRERDPEQAEAKRSDPGVSGTLRMAVVGLGFVRWLLDEYKSAPGVELSLLCDLNEARCRELSDEHGVPWTLRFEDCLAPNIAAVDVSTPNHLHAEQAVAALAAGKHVFLQKPMAPTVADCRTIVSAAAAAGRSVGLFMSHLNAPHMHELRRMIAAAAFGTLISMRGRSAHRGARANWDKWNVGADYWRRDRTRTGGGGMALIGIHVIHLLPWLADSPVESVAAFSDNRATRDLLDGDDITIATARLSNGVLATLEASYASERGSVEIYGTAGYAIMEDGRLRVRLDAPWNGRYLSVAGGEQETVFSHEELNKMRSDFGAECEQHGAFARAVLAGEPPPVTGEDGLRDVAVLEAIYRSAETGRRETPDG